MLFLIKFCLSTPTSPLLTALGVAVPHSTKPSAPRSDDSLFQDCSTAVNKVLKYDTLSLQGWKYHLCDAPKLWARWG